MIYQVPIPQTNVDLIIERSLEQLFINVDNCKDDEGLMMNYKAEEIFIKILETIEKCCQNRLNPYRCPNCGRN